MSRIISMCIVSLFVAQPALAADYSRDVIIEHRYQAEGGDLCGEDETEICESCKCCEASDGSIVWCRTCYCELPDLVPIPRTRFLSRDR